MYNYDERRKCDVEIIEDTQETIECFHEYGWGETNHYITKDQLEEFMNGKLIAFFDGEYTHTIKLKKEQK